MCFKCLVTGLEAEFLQKAFGVVPWSSREDSHLLWRRRRKLWLVKVL